MSGPRSAEHDVVLAIEEVICNALAYQDGPLELEKGEKTCISWVQLHWLESFMTL